MRISASTQRPGLSLLEVLVAMAVFLFALVGIGRLMSLSTDQAIDIQWQSRATRLSQSKLAEFIAGVESLGSSSSGSFDEDPNWQWEAKAEKDNTAATLWKITVTVFREKPNNQGRVEASLSQYICDPKQRGKIMASTASSSSSSSSSSTPSSGTGMTGTGTGGTGMGGGTGGTGNRGGGGTGMGGGGTGFAGSGGTGMGGGGTGIGGGGTGAGGGGTGIGGGGGGGTQGGGTR